MTDGPAAQHGRPGGGIGRLARMTADRIDLHTHGLPRDLPAFGQRYAGAWPEIVATGACTADLMIGQRHFRSIDDRCWDPGRRLADMAAEGVALQVVSPIPVTFSYWLPRDGAAELARAQNEWLAGLVRGDPEHFAGLGTVPLQAPDRAAEMVAELTGDLGLAGVEIGTNVDGAPLDGPELTSFWAACEESRALVFVHPWQVLGAERLRAYNLAYAVGNPAETAAAAATLVLGGVLDRHHRLRIVLAHGGGAFLSLLPRLDQVTANLPGGGDTGTRRPSDYVRRFHYDSLVYDPQSLAQLVARAGADHVAVGTDYPFPIAERPAGAAVDAAGLSPADRAQVLLGTARRLLQPARTESSERQE
jgi:aminocarboxymuconate-semialdehyde decarboxylase